MNSGFKISREGTDVTTATGKDILLNLGYPQAKLDTTKTVSFQNISFLFLTNPPGGAGLGDTATTLVYRIPHGYTYIPEAWVLFQEVTPPAGAAFYQNYFQDSGTISAHGPFDNATFYAKPDATYLNFYVDKFYVSGLAGVDNNLVGGLFKIRPYIFVNDVGV